MKRLKDKEFRIFIYLMALACEINKDGVIDIPIKDLSWALRVRKDKLSSTLSTLVRENVIDISGDKITLLNWCKRQYKSDISTDRVSKHRETKRFKPVTETAPDTDTDTDNIKEEIYKEEKKKPKRSPAFKKPEPHELSSYFIERGLEQNHAISEAQKFYDFYESKNWFVGKNKMKNWQAAVRNWMRNVKPQTYDLLKIGSSGPKERPKEEKIEGIKGLINRRQHYIDKIKEIGPDWVDKIDPPTLSRIKLFENEMPELKERLKELEDGSV